MTTQLSNRTASAVNEILVRIRSVIQELDLTYEDYGAAKQWLIDVGEAGEWPLFLDVFIEHAVERQVSRDRSGSEGTILGPYYLPDSPILQTPYQLPMRSDEPGEPLLFTGRVRTTDGKPLAEATLDVWHADASGLYSGFSNVPAGILRGKVRTYRDGEFKLRTIVPAPYTIPHDGPTGRLIEAAGWHPWRPAHIHLLVTAEGYEQLTTQLYIGSSDYVDDDVASAVKESLIVHLERREPDAHLGFYGPFQHFHYEFRLAPDARHALNA